MEFTLRKGDKNDNSNLSTKIGTLSQEADACLVADIICAAVRAAAKTYCDHPDTPRWACILAENAAETACDFAQEYLCGSSSS